jgi:hypothetical protein
LRLALVCLLCTSASICLGDTPSEAYEYEAKVALLYNFAKLTVWPEGAFESHRSPFVIAVLGKNPFGDAMELLNGKKMHGRSIEIRHYLSLADCGSCQILFLTLEDPRLSKEHSGLLEKHHVLTVGEQKDFALKGGILQLTFVADHLAFEVNIDASRRAGIEMSAGLLKLAKAVIRE